jgi:DNA-binding XRE family transcriptional regulator
MRGRFLERGQAPLSFFFAAECNKSYIGKLLEGCCMDQLGRRLNSFRVRNGWSKRAIALQLGVSIPSIMRWEDGTSEPNDYNRYKIEQLLEQQVPLSDSSLAQLDLFPQQQRGTRSRR